MKNILEFAFWPVVRIYKTVTDPALFVLAITAVTTISGLGFAMTLNGNMTAALSALAYFFGLACYVQNKDSNSSPKLFWVIACSGFLFGVGLWLLGRLA